MVRIAAVLSLLTGALALEQVTLGVPDVEVPEVEVPEAKVPEAKVPEVKVPEAKVPEVKVPEAEVKCGPVEPWSKHTPFEPNINDHESMCQACKIRACNANLPMPGEGGEACRCQYSKVGDTFTTDCKPPFAKDIKSVGDWTNCPGGVRDCDALEGQCVSATFKMDSAPKVEVPKEVEGAVPKEVKGAVPAVPKVEVFPVPTTSRCIVIMCVQYMVIYTALAVCRTYQEFSGTGKGKVEAGLRAAAQTLTYGPMLCVLFIACRMRVEFLSDGKDQPQAWVQNCMYALTFAVLASTLLVLAVPLVTGKPLPLKEGTGDLERPEISEGDSQYVFYALTAARYLILLGLYGGLAGVIVGICTYLPPGATDLSKLPVPAPAVMCTMILAVVFFSTQLVIAICRSISEFKGVEFPTTVKLMNAAATTVEFAPMLSILFLAARMRALQHDSQPQAWAQNCMYYSTFALCLTTLLAIAVPLVMGGSMKTNPVTKEVTFEAPNPTLGYVLVAVRFICMLSFYGGAVGVIYSIFTFEAPGGPAATLPVSPAVQCVVNLTCQFFFVYFMVTAMLTVSEVSNGAVEMDKWKLFAAIDSTKATLAFAPMLSILFVTTRMYALLITDKKGAPQAWVQDGMYMATWSLLISFLMCLVTGLVMDKVETDEDGNVVNKFENQYVGIAVTTIRYLSMLLLYGGMVMVIVGLFVMTPETANGRGSVPLVSDAVNATPVGNPPPGPQAVGDAATNAGDTAVKAGGSVGDAIPK